MNRETCYIKVEKESIPLNLTEEEWVDYCNNKGWHSLGGNRKVWIPEISTYLRNCDTILYLDGGMIDVINVADYENAGLLIYATK